MQEKKPMHYWRIHRRVCRRVFFDLPDSVRRIIASDNTAKVSLWFAEKVAEDTERLFQDESYYDNSEFSFRVPAR